MVDGETHSNKDFAGAPGRTRTRGPRFRKHQAKQKRLRKLKEFFKNDILPHADHLYNFDTKILFFLIIK